MDFFIKEWPNKTATLMSENGTVLWTFHNVEQAKEVCLEWYRVQQKDIQYYLDYSGEDNSFDPAGASCAVA